MKVVMNRSLTPCPTSARPADRRRVRKPRHLTIVEALEPRTVLNASINISAGNVLSFAGDPLVDNVVTVSFAANVYTISDVGDTGSPPPGINITVTNNASGVIVNGSGTPTVTITNLSSLSTAALNFDLGPQTSTINVQSINDPTTVDTTTYTGVDTYNVGNSTNGVQGIANTLSLKDTTGTAAVTIDDSADTTSRTVTLAADNTADTGSITGLAPNTIQFVPSQLHSLLINGGSGGTSTPGSGNAFTVSGTPANVTTSINAGTGPAGAGVVVQATGASSTLNVVFQAGASNAVLGDAASGVQSLLGDVVLSATGGVFSIDVNDAANPTPESVTLFSTGITGLAPGRIDFTPALASTNFPPATLTIEGGSGGNTYDVNATNANLFEQISTGSGANRVFVASTATGGAISIAGQGGTNTITLGADSSGSITGASALQGQILINPSGASGTNALTIDDSNDTVGVNATLSAITNNGLNLGEVIGLTPLPMIYALDGSVNQVILNTGSGNDTLTVDFSGAGGNPIPSSSVMAAMGIRFNAGTGANALALQGTLPSGPFAGEAITPAMPGTGDVALDGSVIAFTGLSLINDTAAATNFSFTPLSSPQSPGASLVVNLGNGPILASGGAKGNGVQAATIFDGSGSTPAAFPSVNFANKTNVSIGQSTIGLSAITFNVINPTPAAGLATLKVITSTSDGSDTTNVNATPAGVVTSVSTPGQSNAITVLATGLAVSPATFSATGGAANSTLNVNAGGTGPVSVTSSAVTVGSQTFSYASEQAINLSNVQEQITSTTSTTLSATQGTALTNAVVGSFINADPYVGSGHFAITINWGDGTTSTGTAVPGASGTGFDVQGSHTYTTSGTFPIAVTVATTSIGGGSVNVGSVPVTTQSFSNTVTATINSTANVAASSNTFLSINSSGPITKIDVSPFGEFQVFFQGLQNGQFFPSDQPIGDAGILIRLPDGTVDGFNLNGRESAASSTNSIAFHPISQTLSPDGTAITTVFDNSTDNNSLGIHYRVTQVISYHTGDPFFTATYQITDEGNQPLNLDVFQAGDLFLADSDQGVGFFNPQTGAIGGVDATGQFKIFFQPNSAVGAQPTNYEEAGFDTIWSVIGGGASSNFNNTALLPTTSPPFNNDPNYIDNGAGLEWKSLAVPVGTPTSISVFTAFGNVNVVGPAGNMQVTNTSVSGPGSLQQAILAANAATGSSPQTITFNIPGGGPHVIALTSALPHLTRPVIIDGTTQPGFAGTPLIEINGASAGADADGLVLDGGNSTIRGLAIDHFTGSGIVLEQAGGDTIAGNYIGSDATGTVAPGNNVDGIDVVGSASSGDSIVGNLIVGNKAGVYIFGGASGTTVAGNHIGVGLGSAGASLANQVGVAIADSPHNVIGGSSIAMANIIADNTMSGVLIFNSALGASDAATGNVVASNVIMDNGQNGVYILNASGNIVGMSTGTATSPGTAAPLSTGGNLLVANGFSGVQISVDNVPGSDNQTPTGAAASANVVQNNLVLNSQHDGIYIFNASGNFIGNGQGGSGNTIQGSGFSGVHIDGSAATGNSVTGNSISSSTKYGVQIDEGSGNTIGGTGSAANQILSSGLAGIQFLTGGQPSTANPTGGNSFAGSTSDSVEGATQRAASVRPSALGVLSLRSGRRVPVVTKVHPTGSSLLAHLKPIRRVTSIALHAARLHR